MKALEFQAELGPNETLSVPADVAARIPRGQPVRVLVLIAEDLDDQGWEQLAATELGLGYAEADGIYDQLSGR